MHPLLNSPFDDLQQATEAQLREQYLTIQKFVDEAESEHRAYKAEYDLPYDSGDDYMFDEELGRMKAIYAELKRRRLLAESELKTGYLAEVNDFDQVVYDAYDQSLRI